MKQGKKIGRRSFRAGLQLVLLAAFSVMATAGRTDTSTSAGKTEWLRTDAGRLKAEVFVNPKMSAHPILVIVLHGDAPFNRPDYQYSFAMDAAPHGDMVAAAILRPGYTDPSGDTSDGKRGKTTGANYTPDRIAMIVTGIQALQKEYQPRATILVGHSGGAAIAADILGLQPQLAQAAVLASCPCDLPPWRQYMRNIHPAPGWDQPVSSLSPLDLADQVSKTVHLRMILGTVDTTTPLRFTQPYADKLKSRGIDVEVSQIPGKGHEILQEPQVEALLEKLVAGL